MTDLYRVIGELAQERARIIRIIESLESMLYEGKKKPRQTGKERRGRKSMDATARQEVSERMKRYWAKRREENGKG